MQIIHRGTPNIHPIFDDFDRLYAQLSEKSQKPNIIPNVYNKKFNNLCNLFLDYGYNGKFSFNNTCYERISTPNSENKRIIVCFSGGKDSLATALYYKKRKYDVYLYHLKGINATYKDEYKAVEKLSEILEIPLIIDEIKLSGTQDWIEHPMKNMIIANSALQFGVKFDFCTRIAFGNFSTSTLDDDPFDVCGGDCYEMWDIYNEIIRSVIPRFKIYTPLINFQSTIDILKDYSELIPYAQSCIGAYRYREKLRKYNESKYNIELSEHRCGSCWKCCLEYCVFCDLDIYEYNKEYYEHCMKILQTTLHKETLIWYNTSDVWNHYFFYSMTKSKHFNSF